MPVEPHFSPLPRSVGTVDPAHAPRWRRKLPSILFILFCLELGAFLLIVPWTGDSWDKNFFSSLTPPWIWDSGYFRGMVSGLGAVNLYIALMEFARMRRM